MGPWDYRSRRRRLQLCIPRLADRPHGLYPAAHLRYKALHRRTLFVQALPLCTQVGLQDVLEILGSTDHLHSTSRFDVVFGLHSAVDEACSSGGSGQVYSRAAEAPAVRSPARNRSGSTQLWDEAGRKVRDREGRGCAEAVAGGGGGGGAAAAGPARKTASRPAYHPVCHPVL